MALLENELYSVNYRGRSENPASVDINGEPWFISYNRILSRLELRPLVDEYTHRMAEGDLAPGYFDEYIDPYTYDTKPSEVFIDLTGWTNLDYMVANNDNIIIAGEYGASIVINVYNLLGELLHTNTLTISSFPVLINSESEDAIYLAYYKSNTQMLYYRYTYDIGATWSAQVLITPIGQPIFDLTSDVSIIKEGAVDSEYNIIFAYRDTDSIKVYKMLIPHAIIGGMVTLGGNPFEDVSIEFSHNNEIETSNVNGHYFNSIISGTPTTITPDKYLYTFDPPSVFMTASDGTTAVNFEATYIGVTISGRVVDEDGNPVQNAAVTFSATSHTEYTDATGWYEYAVESGTSTLVTPSLHDYTFNPENSNLVNVVAPQTVNFTALTDMILISGHVLDATIASPLDDISIVFSHDGHVEHTNVNGYYRRLVHRGTTTRVTPDFDYDLYVFDPAYTEITDIQDDQIVNFLGTYVGNTISGYILDSTSLEPIPDVEVSFSHDGHIELTDEFGYYEYIVGDGITTTVTPSMPHVTFIPENILLTNIINDVSANFDAIIDRVNLSGIIIVDGTSGQSGVEVTLSYSGYIEITNIDGEYSVNVPYGVTTLITPSLNGYTYDPPNYTVNNITEPTIRDFSVDTIRVSGTIDDGTSPMEGVTVNFSLAGSVVTDATGYYELYVPAGQSNIITPSFAGYTFDPVNISINDIIQIQDNKDFLGTPI